MSDPNAAFDRWIADLESRHLNDLEFREVSRALRALSSTYVERRHGIQAGAALSGAGKRAAFALFYGPLHFLLVRHIVDALAPRVEKPTLVDLGCGTGAAGAGWCSAVRRAPCVVGIDRHPWAVHEAAVAYRLFGLKARTIVGDIATSSLPKGPASLLAAFALNELLPASREQLLGTLVGRAERGDTLLVIEPLAKGAAPWWSAWQRTIEASGGRADEWRVPAVLPPLVAKLDRAAGLRHDDVTGRSLFLG